MFSSVVMIVHIPKDKFYILVFLRPRTFIKDSFIHLTSSRNIRVLYFYVIIEQ